MPPSSVRLSAMEGSSAPTFVIPATVVVGQQYLSPYPVDLMVTEKALSLTDSDYAVKDLNGNVMFKVKGVLMSMRDKCILQDPAGNPILTLREKVEAIHGMNDLRDCKLEQVTGYLTELLHAEAGKCASGQIRTMHDRWQAFRGDSSDSKDCLYSVKKSSLIQFKTSLDVFLAGNTKEQVPDFKIHGSFFERSCTITNGDGSIVVAQREIEQNNKSVYKPLESYTDYSSENIVSHDFGAARSQFLKRYWSSEDLIGRIEFEASRLKISFKFASAKIADFQDEPQAQVEKLKNEMVETDSVSDYNVFGERIAKLSGEIVVIKVGAGGLQRTDVSQEVSSEWAMPDAKIFNARVVHVLALDFIGQSRHSLALKTLVPGAALSNNIKTASFEQARNTTDAIQTEDSNSNPPDSYEFSPPDKRLMCKKYTAMNLVRGKDAFGVTVYPNVDYAFIVSLIVILDQVNKEE
ncbi:hypothetical protein ACLOJK_023156 [Asimina triloba]